jgi:hypothetical protein
MSGSDDLNHVARTPIPDDVADALLGGEASAVDGRPELGPIASIFDAARSPGEPEELASLEATVVAFRQAVVARPVQDATAATPQGARRSLTAKAAIVVGAVTLVTAGAAAAATGSVPNPFSPSPVTIDSTRPPVADGTVPSTAPNATLPQTGADHAIDDAGVGGLVEATDRARSIADAASEPGRRDETPAITAPGQTGDTPAITAPGQTGDTPAATAPGQTGDTPSATAPGQTVDPPSSSERATAATARSEQHGGG